MREAFTANLLRIYFNGDDMCRGVPLQQAILQASHAQELMFAMAYRGLEGFGSSATIHRKRALSSSKAAPIMMTIIDRPEKIETLMPILDGTVAEGLIARSSVEVIRLTKDDTSSKPTLNHPETR